MLTLDLEWLAWLLVGWLVGGLVWRGVAHVVQVRTLRRTRTPLGSPVYSWKTPLGRTRRSHTHPGLGQRPGDSFDGGDWGACGDGDGGD